VRRAESRASDDDVAGAEGECVAAESDVGSLEGKRAGADDEG